jgi:hypothetical protein
MKYCCQRQFRIVPAGPVDPVKDRGAERVMAAAIRSADRDGTESISMRRLAQPAPVTMISIEAIPFYTGSTVSMISTMGPAG